MAVAAVPVVATVTLGDIQSEANELIKQGFDSVGEEWRTRAWVTSVQDFKPVADSPKMNTYAKMLVLSANEMETGEYRKSLVRLGVSAAQKLSKMVSQALQSSNECTISFLHGCEHPRIDGVSRSPDGSVELRGYYDFGVSSSSSVLNERLTGVFGELENGNVSIRLRGESGRELLCKVTSEATIGKWMCDNIGSSTVLDAVRHLQPHLRAIPTLYTPPQYGLKT